MSRLNKLAITLVALAAVIGFFLFTKEGLSVLGPTDNPAVQEAAARRKTTDVYCTSTTQSHCYRYICSSGFIFTQKDSVPGTNPLRCTDGSTPHELAND